MDDSRFDRLARLVGSRRSRRGVLGAVAVTLALGARETLAERAAPTRRRRRPPVGGGPACLQPTYDLQDTIDAAPAGATIQLCAGTWTLPATILISRDLTLRGAQAGSVLDGGRAVQVMGIRTGVTVTLQSLSIQHGYAPSGAGIFNQGTLTLNGCEVAYSAANSGGGIYNEGTLTLVQGAIHDNTADASDFGSGGGGGIYNDGGKVTIQGARITANRVGGDDAFGASSEGGGILNDAGVVTMLSGAITGNDAGVYCADVDGGPCVGIARGYGGGIYNLDGTVKLKGGTVSQNTARISTADLGGGGGVYDEDANGNTFMEIANPRIVVDNSPDNCAGSGFTPQNCVNP